MGLQWWQWLYVVMVRPDALQDPLKRMEINLLKHDKYSLKIALYYVHCFP